MGSCISKLYYTFISCEDRSKENIILDEETIKYSRQKSSINVEGTMRKLTNNFYSITRYGESWSPEQKAIIWNYLDFKIFKPIPHDYITDSLFGSYDKNTEEYIFHPPKFIMFNFDYCNGKRGSLRGIACISITGTDENPSKSTLTHPTQISSLNAPTTSNESAKNPSIKIFSNT